MIPPPASQERVGDAFGSGSIVIFRESGPRREEPAPVCPNARFFLGRGAPRSRPTSQKGDALMKTAVAALLLAAGPPGQSST